MLLPATFLPFDLDSLGSSVRHLFRLRLFGRQQKGTKRKTDANQPTYFWRKKGPKNKENDDHWRKRISRWLLRLCPPLSCRLPAEGLLLTPAPDRIRIPPTPTTPGEVPTCRTDLLRITDLPEVGVEDLQLPLTTPAITVALLTDNTILEAMLALADILDSAVVAEEAGHPSVRHKFKGYAIKNNRNSSGKLYTPAVKTIWALRYACDF